MRPTRISTRKRTLDFSAIHRRCALNVGHSDDLRSSSKTETGPWDRDGDTPKPFTVQSVFELTKKPPSMRRSRSATGFRVKSAYFSGVRHWSDELAFGSQESDVSGYDRGRDLRRIAGAVDGDCAGIDKITNGK